MQTVNFLGRVFPEPAQITIPFGESIIWEAPELSLSMEFTCRVEKSLIDVACRVPKYKPGHFDAIYMRALDLSRAQVDLVAFKMGLGATVMLETFVDPVGAKTPIVLKDDRLPTLCTAFTLEQGFNELLVKVIQSVPLFMALRDLVSAITVPHASPVDCARAMDRLKHLVAAPRSKDAQAWKQLRNALQIDEAYLKYITDHSAGPRHGRPGYTPGTATSEVTRRAWIIMNRYLEYLKRNNVQLPISEFPLLVGP